MRLMPRKGAIAKCSRGGIGIIESNGPVEVTYPDGSEGMAWAGRYIYPPEKFGEGWCSRDPEVVVHAVLED
jgi:hypothetical protein